MRKIALVALATMCAPVMAEEAPVSSTQPIAETQGVQAVQADVESAPPAKAAVEVSDESQVAHEFLTLIEAGDFDALDSQLDYEKMHRAYVKQMMYVSGKIDTLSEYVGGVAAGTFETRVREGSMMLGLVSKQLKNVIDDTKGDVENYKKFMRMKFAAMALPDVELTSKVEDGVTLIQAKMPYSETSDLVVLRKDKSGALMAVAFVPKEVEDVNIIVDTLMKRASSAKELSAELEKVGISQSESKEKAKSGEEVVSDLQEELF